LIEAKALDIADAIGKDKVEHAKLRGNTSRPLTRLELCWELAQRTHHCGTQTKSAGMQTHPPFLELLKEGVD
jgi:hypothetical protein